MRNLRRAVKFENVTRRVVTTDGTARLQRHAGMPTNRDIDFDDVRILAAWCEQRAAFRHFRVDRLHVTTVSEECYPGRRQSLLMQWRRQDRDWRSMLTVSDT